MKKYIAVIIAALTLSVTGIAFSTSQSANSTHMFGDFTWTVTANGVPAPAAGTHYYASYYWEGDDGNSYQLNVRVPDPQSGQIVVSASLDAITWCPGYVKYLNKPCAWPGEYYVTLKVIGADGRYTQQVVTNADGQPYTFEQDF